MPLSDVRILVVEDDLFLAECITRVFENEGATVIGPANSVASALRLLADEFVDVASLDVHLGGGETSIAIADELFRLNIPFVYLSGCGRDDLPLDHRSHPFLSKDDLEGELVRTCRRLLASKPLTTASANGLPEASKSR